MAIMRRSALAVNRCGCCKVRAGVLAADGRTASYGCIVLRLDR